MKNKKGFSLVELLAVIALLAIIVVFAVPKVLDSYNTAQKNTLVDEAKVIYTESTNKYLKERVKGNKISNINNENNSLDLSNEDVDYNIRLDSDGNVTALKVKNKKYCIVSKGNEIEDATAEDVILLTDDITDSCNADTLMDGEVITLNLKIKNTSRPIVNDATPTTIYLKYNSGWYDKKTTKGKTISSIDTIPYKKNFYFGGYKLSSDESLVIDYSGKILVDKIGYVSGKAVLNNIAQTTSKAYATFEKKYYKAKLTANGGTGSDVLVTVNYGEKVNFPKNTFTRRGYSFNGWKNTFNESFSDEQQLTYIDDNNEESLSNYRFNVNKVVGSATDNIITYNAQWKANNYTITFNPNGGSVSQTSKTVTFDSAVGTLPTPTYGGHVFSGWYTASSGGSLVTSSTIYNEDSNSTYYARYDTCPAGYYCPGDNKEYECVAGTYSTGGASSCSKCNMGYYTDTGNETKATSCSECPAGSKCDGKVKDECPAGMYSIARSSNCTICSAGTYSSAGSSKCTPCEIGTYSLAKSSTCTKCAVGSYNSSTGQSTCTSCNNGKTTSTTGMTSCNANCSNNSNASSWKTTSWSNNNTVNNLCTINSCGTGYHLSGNSCVANTYYISYKSNGGSGSMSDTTCTYNQGCTLRNNSFTRSSYDFDGWAKSSSGSTAYSNSQTVYNLTSSNNAYVSVYAVWSPSYTCPYGGTLTQSGSSWICIKNGSPYTGTCTDYDDCWTEYYCSTGYSLSGRTCTKTVNKSISSKFTDNWQCSNSKWGWTSNSCSGNCNAPCPSGSVRVSTRSGGDCESTVTPSGTCTSAQQGNTTTTTHWCYAACQTTYTENASSRTKCSTYSCTKYSCGSGWYTYTEKTCYRSATRG